MTRKYKESELAELKRSVSILHVCADHGIELSQHGTNDMKGRCPFHEDDDPSFIVTPGKNLWHCMGCGKGGSVIDLVMQLENLTFTEAVDKMMTSTGLVSRGCIVKKPTGKAKQLKKKASSGEPEVPEVEPGRAAQLLERVASIYGQNLPQSSEALKYLKNRGLDDSGQLAAHRSGYANGRLHEILPKSHHVQRMVFVRRFQKHN
jgi:DNA primase